MSLQTSKTKAHARGHDQQNKTRKQLERERKKAAGLKRCEVWIMLEDEQALKNFERLSQEKARAV